MDLSRISYTGPAFEADSPLVGQLPPNLVSLLQQLNGFIQFEGGLHVRGVCASPEWHSLAQVMLGENALHIHYPAVLATDVPFAQDCVADQFLLRDGVVHRLSAETGEVRSLELSLPGFFSAVEGDPVEFLAMQPLLQFQSDGGTLEPGEVLNVYPPFCTNEAAAGVSLKAISNRDALAFLATFSSQISWLTDGVQIKAVVGP